LKACTIVAAALFSSLLVWTPSAPVRAAAAAQGLSLLSVSDEIELGREAQAQVRQQTPMLNDATVNNYVRGVFSQLARQASGPKYPYSISIADYVEVNAFALPGGPIWVHRGAIQAARNESQLAGVLAHEIAHIEKRHVAKQVTKGTVASGLLALLGAVLPNDRRGQIGQVAGGLTAQGFMLKFGRDAEREADLEGMRIMRRAGWDARGMPDFLDLLRQQQRGNPSAVETFLSDHPAPAERSAALRSQLPAGGRRDSAAFQRIRERLQSMRPAQRMRTR
jgi:predicted Zn-dependent protease